MTMNIDDEVGGLFFQILSAIYGKEFSGKADFDSTIESVIYECGNVRTKHHYQSSYKKHGFTFHLLIFTDVPQHSILTFSFCTIREDRDFLQEKHDIF